MKLLPIAALLLVLAACAPGASVVSAPTFTVVAAGTGLVRLEPPGVGSGAAVIRVQLDAHNPNPIAIRLAGLDGDFALGGRRVAGTRFANGISLPANGTGRLTLDVEAPLAEAPHLIAQMTRLVAGEAVPYRLDGTLSVDVLGTTQRFPSIALAQGTLDPPGPLRPPEVRFDASASRVRLEGLTVRVEVGLEIHNPTLLGFYARGPELVLLLDGRQLGRASLPATPVPALGTSNAAVRVESNIAALGAALFAQLQSGGAGLRVTVDGALAFEIPGVASTSRTLSDLSGTLR